MIKQLLVAVVLSITTFQIQTTFASYSKLVLSNTTNFNITVQLSQKDTTLSCPIWTVGPSLPGKPLGSQLTLSPGTSTTLNMNLAHCMPDMSIFNLNITPTQFKQPSKVVIKKTGLSKIQFQCSLTFSGCASYFKNFPVKLDIFPGLATRAVYICDSGSANPFQLTFTYSKCREN